MERVWGYHTNTVGGEKSGGGDKKSSLLGRQASQTAFRLLLKTGEPVPISSLQEKGWRHLRLPFHIGRAEPADFSAFAATQAEASFLGNFKKAGVFFEQKAG